MGERSWLVGRIAGIEIRIDPSWTIIAVLIAYSFFLRYSILYRGLPAAAALALAVGSAIVFFGSVLAHELAHSVVARARGIRVKGITLFLFGGATQAEVEARGPKDEFLVTVVGPLTSWLLGVVLGLAGWVAGPSDQPIPGVLGHLAWLNVMLGVFNLLPGFPLDGGRILRSIVWAVTGSLLRATRVAAATGHAIGLGLVAFGVLILFSGGFSGLWLAAIGWFLAQAARASLADVEVRHMLGDVPAQEVMSRPLVSVPADTTVEGAVDDYFLRYDHSAFPVTEDGRTLGLLTMGDVRQMPPEERSQHPVTDCMIPIDRVPQVDQGTPLPQVLDRLAAQEPQRILVADHGSVVGIITPRDIARRLQRAEDLHVDVSHDRAAGASE